MDQITATDFVAHAKMSSPPVAVAAASVTDWFQSFPVSTALQWASLGWLLIQVYFFFKDRRTKNGSK